MFLDSARGKDSPVTIFIFAVVIDSAEVGRKEVIHFVGTLPGTLVYIGHTVLTAVLVKLVAAIDAHAVLSNEVELEPLSIAGGSGFVGDIATGLTDSDESG